MFKLVVLVALAVVAVPGVTGLLVRCDGSLDVAVERLRACPAAADPLGADVGPSFVGLSCGSSRQSGDLGQASWETPIAGTRTRGTLRYAAEKRGDTWRILSAHVDIDDLTIPVVPCGDPAALPTGASDDTLACDRGDGAACNRLGVDAARGTSDAPKNLETARALYDKACDAHDATGCANLGALHERDFRDPKAALHYYRLGCDLRSPAACTGLAAHLLAGDVAAQDLPRARALLDDACERGHAPACGLLGAHLATDGDAPRARELVERACKHGDAPSCATLGTLHATGRGGPRDEARAIQLWLDLCDRGEAVGCAALGDHYRARGDAEEARRYLRRACAAGLRTACAPPEPR